MKWHIPPSYAVALAALLSPVSADWQFKSRPDLAPPTLNITIPATSAVEKGYIFIAPFSGYGEGTQHGPLQPGAYIYRDNGDLVWSGYTYFSTWTTNFHKSKWKGRDVLASFEGAHNAAYGHGHGHITILDQRYETIRELRGGAAKLIDKHEFTIFDGRTAGVQVYQPTPKNLSAWGASPEQQWIVDAIFQDLDVETGELLFEWSSLDHVSPDESVLPLNPGQAGSGYNSSDAWDYFHINSVDKDDDGNYLISARDACSVHKINGTTGEIIWRLGGKLSDFRQGLDDRFCFQHDARFIWKSEDGTEEIISLYDNSAHGTESDHGHEIHTAPTSTGKVIKVDTKTWRSITLQNYYPPDDLLSKSQGNTQVLPNGNVFVNWGSSGAVTEFLPNGTAIFHSYVDSGRLGIGVENYRGYRFNWTGYPHEDPTLVSLRDDEDWSITLYVSWNGDTETATWRFYGVAKQSDDTQSESGISLGEAHRTSFETPFRVPGRFSSVERFVAEARSADGEVLAVSGATRVRAAVRPYVPTDATQDAFDMVGDDDQVSLN